MSGVEVDNVIEFRACEALPVMARTPAPISDEDRRRIELLRGYARESLLCSRSVLERACATIAVERAATTRRYALALFGALSEHARTRLSFYPPGTVELSDGEIWLARTIRAFARSDTPSGRALIAWRVRPMGHRQVRFLVGGLADCIGAADAAEAGKGSRGTGELVETSQQSVDQGEASKPETAL